MATKSGVARGGLGADAAATRMRTSMTEIGPGLSTARRAWMEAESAYRTAAIREGTLEALHQLRHLAKSAEQAYCDALAAAADPLARRVGDAPVPTPR